MPHKQAMCSAAARLTDVAARAGAVNTFWWDNDTLIGHNTDVDGIRATVTALCPDGISGDIVLLGAGGAAAAVLVAIDGMSMRSRGRVHVVARSEARATTLIRDVGSTALVHANESTVPWSRVRLVVNATPLGMRDEDPLPLPLAQLPESCAVYDLVYRAQETSWVREALSRGLVAEDGLRMLVEQGASAFECWFGVSAPRDVMWRALGQEMPAPNAPRIPPRQVSA